MSENNSWVEVLSAETNPTFPSPLSTGEAGPGDGVVVDHGITHHVIHVPVEGVYTLKADVPETELTAFVYRDLGHILANGRDSISLKMEATAYLVVASNSISKIFLHSLDAGR